MEPSYAASGTKYAEKLNMMDLCQHVVTGITSTLWLSISTMQFLSQELRCVHSYFKILFESVIYYFKFNTLRTGSFKFFKRPFPGFLTILTL